jgi:thioredoxin 1
VGSTPAGAIIVYIYIAFVTHRRIAMYKYYAICAALSLYISAYTLLGFAREPMRMDFLMDKRPAKLIIFSADWCLPCKVARKEMQQNGELKRMLQDFKIIKYDFDIDKQARKKYNVNKVPTYIVESDGKEIRRKVGFSSTEKLKNFLD